MSASTQITEYPQIPRIDVHTHLGGDVGMIERGFGTDIGRLGEGAPV